MESVGIYLHVSVNSVSQVDGVRYGTILPAMWLSGGRAQKMDKNLCPPFCPPALTLMPNTSLSPCMPLVPFNLLPHYWNSEGVSLSLCVSSLGGTAKDSRSFCHLLNPHWFLQPEVMGTYLLILEPWAGGPGVGLGPLVPQIPLSNFYPPHVGVGPACSASPPLLPVWVDVVFLIP